MRSTPNTLEAPMSPYRSLQKPEAAVLTADVRMSNPVNRLRSMKTELSHPSGLEMPVMLGIALLSLMFPVSAVRAADWPSWGGQASRNMACETEKGLPDWY